MANKKDFSKLSPEWLNSLTAGDSTASAGKAPKTKPAKPAEEDEDDAESFTFEEAKKLAAKYFRENKDCPHDSLVVCSDKTIFYGSLKGQNAAYNHLEANKAIGLTSFPVDR